MSSSAKEGFKSVEKVVLPTAFSCSYPDGYLGEPTGDGGCVQGQAAQVSHMRQSHEKPGWSSGSPGELSLNL